MWVIYESFYCYLAQVVFQDLKKNVGGVGLGAGPKVFCWYAKANLGGFLKNVSKKTGPSTLPRLDLQPAFPVIRLTIHLPNVGLMLAQCCRRLTNNKVTLGKCFRYKTM